MGKSESHFRSVDWESLVEPPTLDSLNILLCEVSFFPGKNQKPGYQQKT
jgi:hypothetical protein